MSTGAKVYFGNWEGRPSVCNDRGRAFAVLEPGGPWVEVDGNDVAYTSRLMSEEAQRRRFGPLPPIPAALRPATEASHEPPSAPNSGP